MEVEKRNSNIDSADDIFDPSFAAKIATKTMTKTYDAYGNPDPEQNESQDYIMLDDDEGYEMMTSLIGSDDDTKTKSSSGKRTKRSRDWKERKAKAAKEKGKPEVVEPPEDVDDLFDEASPRKSVADIIAEMPDDLETFGEEEPQVDTATGRHRRSKVSKEDNKPQPVPKRKPILNIDEQTLEENAASKSRTAQSVSVDDGEFFDETENVEVLDSFSFDADDTFSAPEWVDSLRRKLNSSVAHAFLLSGNIRDYMVRDVSIKDGIVAMLDPGYDGFDVIAEFDQARGLSFYGKHIDTADGRRLSDVYRERFIEQMQEAQKKLSLQVTEDIPNRDIVGLFTVLGYLFDHESRERQARILLFIDHSDFLVPDASSAQMKPDERKLAITLSDIGRSQKADQAGNCMIFLTDDITQLSTRIKSTDSRIERIQLPIPDLDERKDFIEFVLDDNAEDHCLSDGTPVFQHPDSIDKNTFAINTAGLSRIQIEDIVLRAVADDEPLTLQLMKDRKNEIIKEDYDDVLEIIDPAVGFEAIGGMDMLKNMFIEEVIEPVHAGEKEAVPMGILMMGPPGSGKTFLCKAVAHEANMNFVALNLNRIMEKWVGSTERNLDRALDCAMAMAPTIIFIDEIDEALPNRADPNQSAVNKRINQRLLTFFSDTTHRGDVIILAATNYPEKVDPAFKRAGRFDMRFPMFAPDEFDRMRIMQVIAKGRGYSFSWFESPDMPIKNPFKNLKAWISAGNAPTYEGFTGEDTLYSYYIENEMGRAEKYDVILPCRIVNVIDREWITLQQFYEAARILFSDMRERESYTNTGGVETDEKYFEYIKKYLYDPERLAIIGDDPENVKEVYNRMIVWEQVYKSFVDQTKNMTGAELDVVMNKAITLWKRWKRKNPEKIQQGIKEGYYKDEYDIRWRPFLYDACHKVVNAVAGIKAMEDNALLNTSDTDFIPDALYAKTEDNREISYIARHEELTVAQTNAALMATRQKM